MRGACSKLNDDATGPKAHAAEPQRRCFACERCKRSRWFALDCLVEQAEFELRCGLKAALAQAAATYSISARALSLDAARSRTLRLSGLSNAAPNRVRCSLRSRSIGSQGVVVANETSRGPLRTVRRNSFATSYRNPGYRAIRCPSALRQAGECSHVNTSEVHHRLRVDYEARICQICIRPTRTRY